MSTFDDLWHRKRPLLADGALATALWHEGLPADVAVEVWNAREPGRVEALHRAYIAAGADIVLTNTFGGNRHRLAARGLEGRLDELNASGVRLARRAAASVDRPVLVAGSVGPTGARRGGLTEMEATMIFAEQMHALACAGVDVIWIETMASLTEARSAVLAARGVGLPFVLTASLHDGSELGPASLAAFAQGPATPPAAIGYNCGSGWADLPSALNALRAASPVSHLVAKPNAGTPIYQDGGWRYPATVADSSRFATVAGSMGIRVLGGCCGTTPAHIGAMWQATQEIGA